jgi:membrane protease YdiL (CAAX protease family)
MRSKATGLVPFIPIILIIIAEALFFVKDTSDTLSVHLLNLIMCILLAILVEKYSDLFQAFMLISLLRVLNIGMPIFFNLTLYWMPFVYLPVLISAYILWNFAFTDGTAEGSKPGYGFKEALSIRARRVWEFINGGRIGHESRWNNLYIPAAIIIGLVLSNVEYNVLGTIPLIPDLGLLNLVTLAIVMIFFVGLTEELVFRGFLQTSLENHWGVYLAIFMSAFIFSIMHSGYSSVAYLFYVFFVGLLLAVLFLKTRSLMFVVLIHGFLNFFLFSFLPNGWAFRF